MGFWWKGVPNHQIASIQTSEIRAGWPLCHRWFDFRDAKLSFKSWRGSTKQHFSSLFECLCRSDLQVFGLFASKGIFQLLLFNTWCIVVWRPWTRYRTHYGPKIAGFRLLLIIFGFAIACVTNICIKPNFAGNKLHTLVSGHFSKVSIAVS